MNKKLLQKILIFVSPFIIFYLFLKVLPYPELKEFLNKPYSLRIYDRKGHIIQILTLSDGTRREHIAINKIPRLTKKIFIKSEDKRFYFHFGIDPIAVPHLVQAAKDRNRPVDLSDIEVKGESINDLAVPHGWDFIYENNNTLHLCYPIGEVLLFS